MPRKELFGAAGKRLAALLQRKTISSLQLLNEWLAIATEAGDTETQERILKLLKNETDKAEIHQRWQEGDQDFIIGKIYGISKKLQGGQQKDTERSLNGNGNGGGWR